MPVNTHHPEYDVKTPLWKKARDTSAGEEAVKAAGALYLPTLSASEQSDYESYKKRASFFTATGRTIDGLSGCITRKPTKIELPGSAKPEDALDGIGYAGERIDEMIGVSVREELTTGRLGILVDAPQDEDAKPYACIYYAENIINWREAVLDGRKSLIMVVLVENVDDVDPDDAYAHVAVTIYRCLHLGTRPAYTDRGTIAEGYTSQDVERGFYYQEIWMEDPKAKNEKDKFVLLETIVPRKVGGVLWDEIPFTFVGPTSTAPTPEEPPLLDLMNVNLSHYRTSADLEHGRHFTALPTPWFAGFGLEGNTVKIGSGVGYATETPGAHAGMLEFTGAGLASLSTALTEKEKQMAVLGSRLLEGQKAGVEAVEAIKLRTAGEQSALTLIADVLSQAWTTIVRWWWEWANAGVTDDVLEKITIELNKEFNLLGLDAQTLTALMAMLQGGGISWETWVFNLKRAEILPDDVDARKEAALVKKGLPAAMGMDFAEPAGTVPADDEEEPDPTGEPQPRLAAGAA